VTLSLRYSYKSGSCINLHVLVFSNVNKCGSMLNVIWMLSRYIFVISFYAGRDDDGLVVCVFRYRWDEERDTCTLKSKDKVMYKHIGSLETVWKLIFFHIWIACGLGQFYFFPPKL